MHSKLIGSTLLVIGTTIGAGILALPIANAQLGFWGSLVMLISCWAVMTASAFLFLEVNLWLPPSSNLISMAGATLGRVGQIITWFVYLFLLYSISSAYIAGGGDLFHYLFQNAGIPISLPTSSIIFTALIACIVYFGIRLVDYANRCLMFGKMSAFILLIILMLPFISLANLDDGQFKYLSSPTSITITIVAFGCLMIIPSLRTYFGADVASLRKAIFFGMFIPLLCYIAWTLVIMGLIPLQGHPGLAEMSHSASSNSDLVAAISTLVHSRVIIILAKCFTSICMATSFLSVSLALSDFLADGFQVKKQGFGNVLVYGMTFLPSLFIVLFYPDAFLRGLNYAGICCLILMVLLPALMAWRGRYHHDLAVDGTQVRGGKALLAVLTVFAILMIAFGIESAI